MDQVKKYFDKEHLISATLTLLAVFSGSALIEFSNIIINTQGDITVELFKTAAITGLSVGFRSLLRILITFLK